MATSRSKKSVSKRTIQKEQVEQNVAVSEVTSGLPVVVWTKNYIIKMKRRIDGLRVRRPHRSFKRTMRRDYIRPLHLPGYWSFTNHVRRTLMNNRRLFFSLTALYALLTVTLVGIASQAAYTNLSDTLHNAGSDIFGGNWDAIGKAGLLLGAAVTGGFNAPLTSTQQVYAVLLVLMTWLTTVWLLRALLSGSRPKLRDALYNATAPLLSTFIVGIVAVIQLLPVALAAAGVAAAVATGLLNNGVEAMVFWTVVLLLVVLALYWVTSTFIALVVVTLPGMYPLEAIKIAGDLVIGRRLRILLRILWLLFTVALGWVSVMIPIILLDSWLKGMFTNLTGVPVVPISMLIMGSVSVVWAAAYVYLFYRKVVDDDAAPAQ